MKKKLLFFIIIIISTNIFSQNIKVVEDKPITSFKDGKFYYPVISPDGKFLFLTKENRAGLWLKDLSNGRFKKISDANGAGFEPVFNIDGNEIIYRENKIINGKIYSDVKTFNLNTQKFSTIDKNVRDLKFLKVNNSLSQFFLKQNEPIKISSSSSLFKTTSEEISVTVDINKIVLFTNGSKKYLAPAGDGYYLWPSISPDKTKLLFTLAGKGTYVSDLNGKILNKIGYANYPSWSPDGKWVLFMKDLDNGTIITSSEIYIANIITGKYFNLTENQKDISLYPVWGNSNEEIFYNTDDGQIRKIKLQFE